MRARATAALVLLALAAGVSAVGFSAASFTDTTQNPQTVSAVADWLPPTVEASEIVKSQGGVVGNIKPEGAYYIYAKVTDSGNPPSGIASVSADVSKVTSGQTAVPLVAGSYAAGGVSYNYRSTQLTASSSLSAGSKTYTLASADSAGYSDSESFSVTVIKTALEGSGFETSNVSGGTSGKPEKGDTVIYKFNRAPDPGSIVSEWDGSGTKAVTVTISENAAGDLLTVSGAALGSVVLGGDFTEGKATTFTGSSVSVSSSKATIVLGTSSGGAKTNTEKFKPVWTPVASLYDAAGNACSTTGVTGSSAKQF
ncbi:MAG TPA: hypothetical protein VF085_00290 [Solirubrobacterales bacterium]